MPAGKQTTTSTSNPSSFFLSFCCSTAKMVFTSRTVSSLYRLNLFHLRRLKNDAQQHMHATQYITMQCNAMQCITHPGGCCIPTSSQVFLLQARHVEALAHWKHPESAMMNILPRLSQNTQRKSVKTVHVCMWFHNITFLSFSPPFIHSSDPSLSCASTPTSAFGNDGRLLSPMSNRSEVRASSSNTRLTRLFYHFILQVFINVYTYKSIYRTHSLVFCVHVNGPRLRGPCLPAFSVFFFICSVYLF